MKETSEELMKHTRSELEVMAEKLGLITVGVSKKKLAEVIFEKKANSKQPLKRMPKTATITATNMAIPLIKKGIGKKGVFAKREAIKAQQKENQNAIENIFSGVRELHKGIRNMESDIVKKSNEMQKSVINFHKDVAEYQKCITGMRKSIDAQRKENKKAIAKFDSGVKEMQNGVMAFRGEIKAYQDETAQYIKDFYYG